MDKDGDAKRPPWRMVSLASLSKPDKSALLRAKFLDASRRLRAGKLSAGVQTIALPTKIMKEKGCDVQLDLIHLRNVATLTDTCYTRIHKGTDDYVLTYSVGQVTDAIQTADAATQTLLPRFVDLGILGTKTTMMSQQGDTDESRRKTSLLTPTLASWNFLYEDSDPVEKCGGVQLMFQPYAITPFMPWSSFIPLVREEDIWHANKRWQSFLRTFDQIFQKSNRLLSVLHSSRRSPADDYSKRMPDEADIKYPSAQWLPIIEQEESELLKLQNTASNCGTTNE